MWVVVLLRIVGVQIPTFNYYEYVWESVTLCTQSEFITFFRLTMTIRLNVCILDNCIIRTHIWLNLNKKDGYLALWIELCCNERRNATLCQRDRQSSNWAASPSTRHKPLLMHVCLRARTPGILCVRCGVWVCECARAPSPCLRGTEFACEELDMSLKGIRHLKRKEVKATHLRIKHQPTSASSSCKADENISSELGHGNLWRIVFYFPLDLSLGNSASRCKPGETHLRAALEVDVTPTASIILELSSDRRYSGWVQSFLGVISCTSGKKNVSINVYIFKFLFVLLIFLSNLIRFVRNFILGLETSALNCTWTQRVIFPLSARRLTKLHINE